MFPPVYLKQAYIRRWYTKHARINGILRIIRVISWLLRLEFRDGKTLVFGASRTPRNSQFGVRIPLSMPPKADCAKQRLLHSRCEKFFFLPTHARKHTCTSENRTSTRMNDYNSRIYKTIFFDFIAIYVRRTLTERILLVYIYVCFPLVYYIISNCYRDTKRGRAR